MQPNPKIDGMLNGATNLVKLQTYLAVAALMDPRPTVDDVLAMIVGAPPDFDERIPEAGNKPLERFVGKTIKQLLNEFPENLPAVDAIVDAFHRRGIEVQNPEKIQRSSLAPIPTAEPLADDEDPEDVPSPRKPAKNPNVASDPSLNEKTYGNDQLSFTDVAHMSEGELRSIEGVTDADVAEILAASKQQGEAAAAQAEADAVAASEAQTAEVTADAGNTASVAAGEPAAAPAAAPAAESAATTPQAAAGGTAAKAKKAKP